MGRKIAFQNVLFYYNTGLENKRIRIKIDRVNIALVSGSIACWCRLMRRV